MGHHVRAGVVLQYPILRFGIERRKKAVRLVACISLIAAGAVVHHFYKKSIR